MTSMQSMQTHFFDHLLRTEHTNAMEYLTSNGRIGEQQQGTIDAEKLMIWYTVHVISKGSQQHWFSNVLQFGTQTDSYSLGIPRLPHTFLSLDLPECPGSRCQVSRGLLPVSKQLLHNECICTFSKWRSSCVFVVHFKEGAFDPETAHCTFRTSDCNLTSQKSIGFPWILKVALQCFERQQLINL